MAGAFKYRDGSQEIVRMSEIIRGLRVGDGAPVTGPWVNWCTKEKLNSTWSKCGEFVVINAGSYFMGPHEVAVPPGMGILALRLTKNVIRHAAGEILPVSRPAETPLEMSLVNSVGVARHPEFVELAKATPRTPQRQQTPQFAAAGTYAGGFFPDDVP